jgi:hypothetical protein
MSENDILITQGKDAVASDAVLEDKPVEKATPDGRQPASYARPKTLGPSWPKTPAR